MTVSFQKYQKSNTESIVTSVYTALGVQVMLCIDKYILESNENKEMLISGKDFFVSLFFL